MVCFHSNHTRTIHVFCIATRTHCLVMVAVWYIANRYLVIFSQNENYHQWYYAGKVYANFHIRRKAWPRSTIYKTHLSMKILVMVHYSCPLVYKMYCLHGNTSLSLKVIAYHGHKDGYRGDLPIGGEHVGHYSCSDLMKYLTQLC